METRIEHFSSPEIEEQTPRPSIRLEFFRHDEKAQVLPGEKMDDRNLRLSEQGRIQATEKGELQEPNPEVSIVYGSPRPRSTETAYRHMLADEEEITPDMSLEDIREKIDENLKVGKKEISIKNLDFDWSGSPEFNRVSTDHYKNTGDALVFIFEESDKLVLQLKDSVSMSYSRTAGNIAELIKKYVKIFPLWKKIANEKPEKYEKFKNELQRFFGSHQTVLETFLLKVIEKSSGRQAVVDFIESLPSKNGFDYSQGFTIRISDSGDTDPLVVISFNNQEWILTPSLLDEIIQDRTNLDFQTAK